MNLLQNIFKRFEPLLNEFGEVYIAGGAVRDVLLGKQPKDIDIFVLGGGDTLRFPEVKPKIINKLSDRGFRIATTGIEWHKSEPFLVMNISDFADNKPIDIQILFNPAPNIFDLLKEFDWEICMFAFGNIPSLPQQMWPTFYHEISLSDIQKGKFLKLNKVTFPLSTLRRGFRFSERFLMRLRKQDIELLCQQILNNKNVESEPVEKKDG